MNATQSLPASQSDLVQSFRDAFAHQRAQHVDGDIAFATYSAAAVASRQLLESRWSATQQQDAKRTQDSRRVHYLSMEFLMGRALDNAMSALGLKEDALKLAGREPHVWMNVEPDAALGNGGLGRLAACFLDSFAALELPSFGYGLRYQNGMFAQRIQDGQQFEVPDEWLKNGNPWEVERRNVRYAVGFGGVVTVDGTARRWRPQEVLNAHAFDFIVPAHNSQRVSTLRMWHASAGRALDFQAFCRGEHAASAAHFQQADTINWVLYPDDSTAAGRSLRLKQEFFLVSASLQDMLARHVRECGDISLFGQRNTVHLNDTHPALAPAELMRLLVDEYGLSWEAAWKTTSEACSYTNHTLMPEALETWPVALVQQLLPRHLEIVFEVNRRFLEEVAQRFPGDAGLVERVSLIDESGERRVKMAALAIVASRKINGVSALHSQLMVDTIFADYARIWPDRFLNVTNGVTPRRWLQQANPALSKLLDETIGERWRKDLDHLKQLNAIAAQTKVGHTFMAVKRDNKQRLADYIRRELGINVNIDSMFDVQIKRVHEYKRQLLNVLQVIARYQAIVANPQADWTPRTVIFAGKAASAYHMAKLIIRLVHDVARVVNSDPRVGDKLKVVYIPNYSVSLAELIIPAADLSEQISTAGTEASGTGNMKFSLNGALTIGTWDGANIEMAQAMGEQNMFIFGLRADAVTQMKSLGYDPKLFAEQDLQLQGVLSALANGDFSPGDAYRYRPIVDNLLHRDQYMLLADFAGYIATQSEVDALYRLPEAWAQRMIRNIAGMGYFSSDRTIAEYREKVWNAVCESVD